MHLQLHTRRRLVLFMILGAMILYWIDSLILWLDLFLQTDILYAGSLLWRILGWRDSIFTLMEFILLFGCLIAALRMFGVRSSLPLLSVSPLLIAVKYLLQSFFVLMQNGFELLGFSLYQLPLTLSSLFTELAQWGVITILLILILHRHPTKKTLPLFITSAVCVAVKIALRVLGDIEYGAPDSVGDLLYMIAAYLSDVLLFGVLLYLGMNLIIKTAEKSAVFFD